MGPNSRALLQRSRRADLSNEALPVRHVAGDRARLGARCARSRITYVGELGWELYVPTEFAQSVFDVIVRRRRAVTG